MKIRKKQNKIAIFSMTFNRPEYLERSFNSLYDRAGISFDHFVFDDNSNTKTQKVLKRLQKKYKFKLFVNSTRYGLFRNFHLNIKQIPNDYEYYVKFDSDVELLSSNVIKELTDVFKLHSAIIGATPRIEGVFNSDRKEKKLNAVQFFGGHAIHIGAPVVAGCCLMFAKKAFETFPRLSEHQLSESTEKWGIDAALYTHSLRFGKFASIEDLSVYHIDNTYGQRKKDTEYFTDRERWCKIDKDEVWFMKLSKDIFPKFLDRSTLEMLKRSLSIDSFEEFGKMCKSVIKHGLTGDEVERATVRIDNTITEKITNKEPVIVEHTAIEKEIIQNKKIIIYKVSAPQNFVSSPHIKKGEIFYYSELPAWTRFDPGVAVEQVLVMKEEATKLLKTNSK